MNCVACINAIIQKLTGYRYSGLVAAAFCGLFFTLSNFMAQVALEMKKKDFFHPFEIVFVRSLVQLSILCPIVVVGKLHILVDRPKIVSLLLVSATGFFNIVLLYTALEIIPVADALVITFTCPVFASVFAYFILKERISLFDAACAVVSFIGLLCVARPTFIFGVESTSTNAGVIYVRTSKLLAQNVCNSSFLFHMLENKKFRLSKEMFVEPTYSRYLKGAGYALSCGVCLALYFVLSRTFAMKSQKIVTLLYPSALGVILSPFLIYAKKEAITVPESVREGFVIISVGIFSVLALACLTLALELEDATYVTLIRNLDSIYSYLLQYFFLGIKPCYWSIGGGVIIILATSCMTVRRHWIRNAVANPPVIVPNTYVEDFRNNARDTEGTELDTHMAVVRSQHTNTDGNDSPGTEETDLDTHMAVIVNRNAENCKENLPSTEEMDLDTHMTLVRNANAGNVAGDDISRSADDEVKTVFDQSDTVELINSSVKSSSENECEI